MKGAKVRLTFAGGQAREELSHRFGRHEGVVFAFVRFELVGESLRYLPRKLVDFQVVA